MPQVTQYPGMPRLPYWKFTVTGPPKVVTAPHATGSGTTGSTLSCTMGTWTNVPSSYAYQWLRNGVAIAGATANTHVVVAADVGTDVSCEVTATNSYGDASSISNIIAVTSLTVVNVEKHASNPGSQF
jgi:hypothetical protein